jgi:hypothetical protein
MESENVTTFEPTNFEQSPYIDTDNQLDDSEPKLGNDSGYKKYFNMTDGFALLFVFIILMTILFIYVVFNPAKSSNTT